MQSCHLSMCSLRYQIVQEEEVKKTQHVFVVCTCYALWWLVITALSINEVRHANSFSKYFTILTGFILETKIKKIKFNEKKKRKKKGKRIQIEMRRLISECGYLDILVSMYNI